MCKNIVSVNVLCVCRIITCICSISSKSSDKYVYMCLHIVSCAKNEMEPPTCTKPTTSKKSATRRSTQVGNTVTSTRSISPLAQASQPHISSELWKTKEDPDTASASVQRDTLLAHSSRQKNTTMMNQGKRINDTYTEDLYKFFGLLMWSTCHGVNAKSPKLLETGSYLVCAPSSQSHDYYFGGLGGV